MSWAAHELESLILHRHMDRPGAVWRISYMAILIGALMPVFTKLPVYGLRIGRWELIKAPEPWLYHRGWPGVGPTHSLVAGIIAASVVYLVTRNRPWGIGVLIGYWSHVLTDTADSVGTMLFFPFTTQHYSIGMWQYSSQEGRYGDAAAYFSSLGWAWDVTWIVLLVVLAPRRSRPSTSTATSNRPIRSGPRSNADSACRTTCDGPSSVRTSCTGQRGSSPGSCGRGS